MRALLFCALALAVAVAHLAAWEALAGRLPGGPHSPRGAAAVPARRVAWVSVVPARIESDPGPADVGRPARAVPAAALAHAAPGARPAHAVQAPGVRAVPQPGAGAGRASPRPPEPAPLAAGLSSPWPVYATRAPPALRLSYALRQTQPGGAELTGRAELAWTGPGPEFALRLATMPAGRVPREWLSEGGFDRAGLAPRRLVQRDGDRVTRSVEFDRASGHPRWTRAAPESALALAPGAQDSWSWIAQLAAIAEAQPRRLAVAHLQVAGLRGELGRWTFRATPDGTLPPEALAHVPAHLRAAPLLHLVREPERPYDLRVEAWLAPAIHHFPVALRLATPPSRWSFGLWLDAVDAG